MESLESSDTSKKTMSHLLDCSHEVLHNILAFCQPADLGALSRTCRSLHAFILDNVVLCKELYLQKFDPPETTANIDWELQLRDLIKLDRLLASDDEEYKVSIKHVPVERKCLTCPARFSLLRRRQDMLALVRIFAF